MKLEMERDRGLDFFVEVDTSVVGVLGNSQCDRDDFLWAEQIIKMRKWNAAYE